MATRHDSGGGDRGWGGWEVRGPMLEVGIGEVGSKGSDAGVGVIPHILSHRHTITPLILWYPSPE